MMSMNSVAVPRASVEITYAHRDISHDIAPYLLGLTYVDHLNGESDTLELSVLDPDKRWRDAWYPDKGDTIRTRISFEDQWLDCGTFELDEIETSGEGVVTLHALATGLSSPMRTNNSKGFDGATLASIAEGFARKHNIVLSGQIRDIAVDRACQYHETDLGFLKRLGRTYGYLFSVKKGRLLFSELAELRHLQPTKTITEDMLQQSWHIQDKVHGVYKAIAQTHHEPSKRKTHRHHKAARQTTAAGHDTLRHHHRAHHAGTAQVQSQAMLDHANIEQTHGTLPLVQGDTGYSSGVAVALQGFGVLSGTYQVDTATHTVNRDGGYTTEVEVKRTDKLPVIAKHKAHAVKPTTKPATKSAKLTHLKGHP